jgi:hypothetical protein
MALLCKRAITRKVPASNRLLNEFKLVSGKEWTVKRDMQKLDYLLINGYVLKRTYPRLVTMIPTIISNVPRILGVVIDS